MYKTKAGTKATTGMRKRWFATLECFQCGNQFTVREQAGSKHLTKPCVSCARRKIAFNNFIKKATDKHDDKFDYSLITEQNYINLFTAVKIGCKNHGVFEQKPKDHISKANAKLCCPSCIAEFNKVHNKRTIESWKDELQQKAPHLSIAQHGNADSNLERCTVFCTHHGEFTTTLASIKTKKHICSLCAQDHNSWGGRFRRTDIPGILYFIEIPELNLYKLGVTSKTVAGRLKQLKFSYTILWEHHFPTLKEAYEAETRLFKKYKTSRRGRNAPAVLGKCKGNSELMTCLIPKTAIQCSNTLSKEP